MNVYVFVGRPVCFKPSTFTDKKSRYLLVDLFVSRRDVIKVLLPTAYFFVKADSLAFVSQKWLRTYLVTAESKPQSAPIIVSFWGWMTIVNLKTRLRSWTSWTYLETNENPYWELFIYIQQYSVVALGPTNYFANSWT